MGVDLKDSGVLTRLPEVEVSKAQVATGMHGAAFGLGLAATGMAPSGGPALALGVASLVLETGAILLERSEEGAGLAIGQSAIKYGLEELQLPGLQGAMIEGAISIGIYLDGELNPETETERDPQERQ